MKTIVRRFGLVLLLVGALSSTTAYADGYPAPPICPPGTVCG